MKIKDGEFIRKSLGRRLQECLDAKKAAGEISGWSVGAGGPFILYTIEGVPYGDSAEAKAFGSRDLVLTPGEAAEFCGIVR